MKRIIPIIFFLIFTTVLYSQEYILQSDSSRPSYGLFSNVSLNIHSASFKGFEGIPSCCPRYETGTGIGIGGGIFYSFPISNKYDIFLRALYTNLSGKLSVIEHEYLATNSGNGTPGEFKHSVDATISSLGLEPLIAYKINSSVRINLGFRFTYIMQKTFKQKEEIIKPDFGTFEGTNSRTRHEYSGDIPGAATLDLALTAGISYDLPLNKANTMFIVPEISYSYGLFPISSDLAWNIHTFKGGFAIKYSPRKAIPPTNAPLAPPIPALPLPPEMPLLDASIVAVSVNENGMESEISTLMVEESLSTRWQPFLNFIFFDENSDSIPSRYIRMSEKEKSIFTKSDKSLNNLSTIEVYHYLLNIIGKRLINFPEAELTLIGCNSNEGVEKNNIDLSKRRAEAVKNFLINEWDIDVSKINIQSRNLPAISSNTNDKLGVAENRRVEIVSSIPDIFEPLMLQDTIRVTNSPLLRFRIKVNSKIGISKWKLVTYQENKELKVFSGEKVIPDVLELQLRTEAQYVPRFDIPFKYKLEITDNDNKIWESAEQEIPVAHKTIQKKITEMLDSKEIYNYSLISFEFNKAELTPEHKPILDIAKRTLQANSIVKIEGHSDIIGEENFNKELSHRRAVNTAKALNTDLRNAIGVGESNPLFDNDLPEGRFYNRTVNIRIETPIDYGR